MPINRHHQYDSPTALQTVSDRDKARAVSAAIFAVSGEKLDAAVTSIDYTGFFSRGPFIRPTRIRFILSSRETESDPDRIVARLQAVDDQTIADAIAENIGKLSGEGYRAIIDSKQFRPTFSRRPPFVSIARVTTLLALATPAGD